MIDYDVIARCVLAVVVVVFVIGYISSIKHVPNSHDIGNGTCYVCGKEKNNTCRYEKVTVTKGNSVKITYRVCDDCIIDLCKSIKKEEKEEKQ